MKKIVTVFVILVLGIFGYRIYRKVTQKPGPSLARIQEKEGIPVEVEQVRPETFVRTVSFSGRVASEEEAVLSSKTGGRIIGIYKNIGDTVRQGELLARVDTSQLELQRIQAANQTRMAEKNLNQVQLHLENARKDLARMENLFREGAISQKQLERYQLDFQTSREQYESSQAQLEVARNNFRIVETSIQDAAVRAPFTGIIGSKRGDVGEVVAPGAPVFTLFNTAKLNAQLEVPEQHVVSLRQGQKAELSIDSLPGTSYRGHLTRVSGAPDPDTRLYCVHVSFDSRPEGLKPGLFLRGKITIGEKKGVLSVPNQALLQESGSSYVFVARAGKAEKRSVTLGEKAEDRTEITAGLQGGEQVIIFGKENVSNGSRVKITSGEANP